MTNKIQLRRDTTANWARVNPILDDGEPGLDITTNQIKYGDGSTAWDNLPYASGGGGGDSIVNGNYSVSVGSDGVVTMETSRGNLEFGALPEPGGPSHFHIMRASGDNADLYFGDDFNYMLQRGPALGQTPGYGVEIGTNDNDSGSQHVWRFGTDGTTTFPNSSTFNGVDFVANENDELNLTILDSSAYIGVKQSSNLTEPAAYMDVYFGKKSRIRTTSLDNQTEYDWYFNPDGSLTLPGDLHGAEIFESSPNGPISAGHQLNITPASNATDKKFEFAINQNSSGVFQNAALQLPTSENNKQVYLSFPGHDGGDSSSSIVSLWNQNTNSGPSDFNNAFNILANGKDIKLTAEAINGSYSTWTFDSSGNLTLPTGGEIHSAAGTGPVVVQSNDGNNTRTWTFGTNGSLTFPDTTTQSTAYKRTTGSWTVATGSGTYSFTVPLNGTYTMWVRGNIDNGIVVWNATATVTNNDVPVIGSQRAWNYTDSGSPILITSIPSQILDEQATISTTMPIGIGTTSNVFNFDITNSSGSEQIVYWGYVTQ